MEKFKLSDEYVIYKVNHKSIYSKESFIKRISQNKSILNQKTIVTQFLIEKSFIKICVLLGHKSS
jgi:hypothetical protein